MWSCFRTLKTKKPHCKTWVFRFAKTHLETLYELMESMQMTKTSNPLGKTQSDSERFSDLGKLRKSLAKSRFSEMRKRLRKPFTKPMQHLWNVVTNTQKASKSLGNSQADLELFSNFENKENPMQNLGFSICENAYETPLQNQWGSS